MKMAFYNMFHHKLLPNMKHLFKKDVHCTCGFSRAMSTDLNGQKHVFTKLHPTSTALAKTYTGCLRTKLVPSSLLKTSLSDGSILPCLFASYKMDNFYCTSVVHGPETLNVRAHVAYLEGSPLTTKRIVRRKKTKDLPPRDQEVFDVLAFATADRYNMRSLKKDLIQQGLYQYIDLPQDMVEEAIHVEAIYGVDDESRVIFFFKEGAVVFWNMPDVERNSVLKFLRRHQEGSYVADVVREEFEHIEYTYTGSASSKLQGDEIYLSQSAEGSPSWDQRLDRYAFSNALALSVKLAIWEAMLDQYVDSIEYILQDLKDGKKIRLSETDVVRKAGWLLHLRHLINLRSDLLDPPDPYWDRENLEKLFNNTYSHLDIARRTKVMNEKLNHCCELTTMLQDLLKDKHHTRLEWMIIILIMIEVFFEFFHTYEKRHKTAES